MTSTDLIPQPKTYGPLGNLPLIDTHAPVQSLVKLSYEYGPIFRMDLPEGTNIYISGHKLVADACDESRFDKQVWAPLQKVRALQETDYSQAGLRNRTGARPTKFCCQASVSGP